MGEPGGARSIDERYAVRGVLGEGAMGVVYDAHDRVRHVDVALKSLRRLDGAALYRFKNEFRAFAGLSHPNLVAMYELISVDGRWFVAMELVRGVSFLEFVRPHRHLLGEPRGEDAALAPTVVSLDGGSSLEVTAPATGIGRGGWRGHLRAATLDDARLRGALRQLAAGVAALHRAGKLHRDLKPSNVLVETGTGRVVVCDLGLVAEAAPARRAPSEGGFVGTPAYAAPEQLRGEAASFASDWYSVGVMLYEALTGALPPGAGQPEGRGSDAPARPSRLAPSVPPDLDALCVGLLERSPAARPSGDEVVAATGAGGDGLRERDQRGGPFVGRGAELEVLRDALRATRGAGRSVGVFVHGQSGVGKTALAREFLREAREEWGALCFEGRCFEREWVPYEALDAIVDAVAAELIALSPQTMERILPRELASLTRLFPVLGRVSAVDAALPRSPLPPAEPQEQRRRGFAALRALLHGLAAERPVVLYIDDLQWGDTDSAGFLLELLHAPRGPELLLLASYRDVDAETSPLLRLLRSGARTGSRADRRELELGLLGAEDAVALARQCLGGAADDLRVAAVAREAAGHPLFARELALAYRDGEASPRLKAGEATSESGRTASAGLELERILAARIAGLPAPARRLASVIAVAGRPLPSRLASAVAEVGDEVQATATLQVERIVRTRAGRVEELEPYHDRVRAALLARLSPAETRELHASLARALDAAGGEPQAVVEHWLSAGDCERAAAGAEAAALAAQAAFAFDRAARFFELALDRPALSAERRQALREQLASCLGQAGRLRDAAERYLEAADGAEPARALDLRRRALEHLFHTGQLERGMALAREVVSAVGLRIPRGHAAALASIAFRRAWTRVRGLPFALREPGELARLDTRWADVYWSVSASLPFVDPLIGTAFQMAHVHRVLALGDPYRAALALTMECGFRGAARPDDARFVDPLLDRAAALAEHSGDAYAIGRVVGMRGLVLFFRGEYARAYQELTEGLELAAAATDRGQWENSIVQTYRMSSLYFLGRIAELCRVVPVLLRDALDRGNLYLAAALRGWRTNVVWLARDEPEEARRQAEDSASALTGTSGFSTYDFFDLMASTQNALYRGEGGEAHRVLDDRWPTMVRSPVWRRVQSVRIDGYFLRARSTMAAVGAGELGPDATGRELAAIARALRREGASWANALADFVAGSEAVVRGQLDGARHLLVRAVAGFRGTDMRLMQAVTELRLGELEAGDAGLERIEQARAWMHGESIADPERMAAMLAPRLP